MAEARQIHPRDIAAIGLAIAAPVNVNSSAAFSDRRGRLRVDLGGRSSWLNVDPLAALTNHLAALEEGETWSSIPLHVDNDANLGALAELKQGAARGKQNVLYVHLDERGIGGGLIFNGALYHGSGGVAGEVGHAVHDMSGPTCQRCGRPCIEAAVLAILGRGLGSTLEQLVLDALEGSEGEAGLNEAGMVIDEAITYLGNALAGFATLLNFDRILIGGPFPARAYSLVVPRLQATLAALVITPAAHDYVVELGSLGSRAILDGAVWLALERSRVEYVLARAAEQAQRQASSRAPSTPKVRHVRRTESEAAQRSS